MRFSRICLLAVFLSGSLALAQSMTVEKLVAFIQSAIKQQNADKDVASVVSSVRLTERFTLADLQELQTAGVGPKTLTALSALVTQSAKLNPPPPKMTTSAASANSGAKPGAGLPTPTDVEWRRTIRDTREWALGYVKSLPNFLCLEVTNRSLDPRFQAGKEPDWTPSDRVIEKLTFFDHKENYELFQHNDTAVMNKSSESLGGARSTGEWATLLSEIFEPQAHTLFSWMAWKTVRGKVTQQFRYVVERQYSQQVVSHGSSEKVVTGFHGDFFVENDTNAVLRVTVTPDIPPAFPVQDVDQTVDYDYQTIGDQKYLLPLKSQVVMRVDRMGTMNEIQWRSYRKYSADTSISFDSVDDAPAKKK